MVMPFRFYFLSQIKAMKLFIHIKDILTLLDLLYDTNVNVYINLECKAEGPSMWSEEEVDVKAQSMSERGFLPDNFNSECGQKG